MGIMHFFYRCKVVSKSAWTHTLHATKQRLWTLDLASFVVVRGSKPQDLVFRAYTVFKSVYKRAVKNCLIISVGLHLKNFSGEIFSRGIAFLRLYVSIYITFATGILVITIKWWQRLSINYHNLTNQLIFGLNPQLGHISFRIK